MEKLLNVVNYPLFEILWIVTEHSYAGDRLCHRCFVTTPNGLDEIMREQVHDTVCVSL